jgi:hypothetical protein
VTVFPWTDRRRSPFQAPSHWIDEDGDLCFHDYPALYAMKIGDYIQYNTALDIGVFEVYYVGPADIPNFPPEMRLVKARRLT